MDFSGWGSFEDLARACGYTNVNNSNNSNTNDNTTTNEFNNTGCFDIPNGFQSLNPELFVAIGGILGQIMAGNIPYNVQNALGNWFELLGQVILTYNAQQQYFQSGPGRYFNPQNYNVNNQFCNINTNDVTQNSDLSKSNKKSSRNGKKSSRKNNDKNSSDEYNKNLSEQNKVDKINELESRINDLISEIEVIKNTINISTKK